MLLVDTDNGLGSRKGDVDDGFALIYLHRAGMEFEVNTTFGNCPEHESYQNCQQLERWLDTDWHIHRGAARACFKLTQASTMIAARATSVLALGPLTNIAAAIDTQPQLSQTVTRIICVGGNPTSRGNFAPIWPHEFNLVKDGSATRKVLASSIPVTFLPINLASQIRLHPGQIPSRFPRWIAASVRRRSRRNLWVHQSPALRLFDVCASVYLTRPELFETRQMSVGTRRSGALTFKQSTYQISMVVNMERDKVQAEFEQKALS